MSDDVQAAQVPAQVPGSSDNSRQGYRMMIRMLQVPDHLPVFRDYISPKSDFRFSLLLLTNNPSLHQQTSLPPTSIFKISSSKLTQMASTSTKRPRSKFSKSQRQSMGFQHPLDEEINDFEGKKGSTEPKTALTKTHYLVVDEIANTNVYNLLEFQGWLDFLKEPLLTKPSLVHWFYRYFKTELTGHYVPKVNLFVNMPDGSKLEYNQDDFSNDFGLVGDVDRVDVTGTSRAFKDYDLTTWPHGLKRVGIANMDGVIARLNNLSQREQVTEWLDGSVVLDGLTGDDKLLLKIVKGIVLPCNSNDNSISDILGVILCMIRERVKINLPVLILKHMEQAPTNRQTGTLPYGGLITHIVRRWGIVPEGDEPEIAATPIGRLTYRKQQSILLGRRLV